MEERSNFRRIIRAYRDLLGILSAEAPAMVVSVFVIAVASGGMQFLRVAVNRHVFDDGLALAQGRTSSQAYLPYIIAFVVLAIVPGLLENVYVYGYVEPRALLVLRTAFKSRMLEKLRRMKYEHLESDASMQIIDKAYHRAENSARHLFPMYVMSLQGLTYGLGILVYLGSIKWWLVLSIAVPMVAEIWYGSKHNYNIYNELEGYWARERAYQTLGGYLRSRGYFSELKLFGSSD